MFLILYSLYFQLIECFFLPQAYTSINKAPLSLRDHKDLAKHMNTVIFHTRMIDSLDDMLSETSNLSFYWLVPFKFNLRVRV